MAWILWLVLSVPPVLSAEPAAAAEVPQLDAGEYNELLVDRYQRALERLDRLLLEAEAASTPEAWAESRREARAELAAAAVDIGALRPPAPDHGFRDAVLQGLEWAREEALGPGLDEWRALVTRENPVDADLARAEEVYRTGRAAARRADEAVRTAQRAFAQGAGLSVTVVPGPERHREVFFDLDVPGFPARPSELPDQFWIGFAVGHGDAFVDRASALQRIVGAYFDRLEEGPAGAVNGRLAALEALREVKAQIDAMEPWQGDDSLVRALEEAAAGVEAVLEGPARVYAELVLTPPSTQRRVDRINEQVAAINTLPEVLRGLRPAHEAFAERWHFEARRAWGEAQKAAAAEALSELADAPPEGSAGGTASSR